MKITSIKIINKVVQVVVDAHPNHTFCFWDLDIIINKNEFVNMLKTEIAKFIGENPNELKFKSLKLDELEGETI